MFAVSVANCSIGPLAPDELPSFYRSRTKAHGRTELYLIASDSLDSSADNLLYNMEPRPSAIDPYQVLQIRRDATPSEIRHAYKRLALWHHPDRHVMDISVDEVERRRQVFEVLAACYETLMDKEAKVKLDAWLSESDAPASKWSKPVDDKDNRTAGPSNAYASTTSLISAIHDSAASSSLPLYANKLDPNPLDDVASVQSQPLSLAASTTSRLSRTNSWSSIGSVRYRLQRNKKRKSHSPTKSPKQVSSFWGLPDEESADEADAATEEHRQSNSLLPAVLASNSTHTTAEAEKHYTEHETNRLFGGPLGLLYRARRWKPFTDPFDIFSQVFQSEAWTNPSSARSRCSSVSPWKPTLSPSWTKKTAAWAGSSEKRADGSVVCTTTRTLHDRILVRTEVIRTDPATGARQSWVSVTSEPLLDEADSSGFNASSLQLLDACGMDFTLCFPCG
jgi:hypothetical protein